MNLLSPAFKRFNVAILSVTLLATAIEAAEPDFMERPATARIQRVRGIVTRVVLDAKDRAIIDGKFFLNTGDDSEFLTRILPDGETDLSYVFNTRRLIQLTAVAPTVLALEHDNHGRILVAVGGNNQEGQPVPGEIHRLDKTGRVDATFSTRGQFSKGDAIFSIRALKDDRILVAGVFQTGGDNRAAHVLRLHPSGEIDPMYESAKTTLEVTGLAARVIEPAGKTGFYIGKAPFRSETLAEANTQPRLTLVNNNGQEDMSFARRASRHVNDGVYSIRRLKDGRLLVGGIATLVRLLPTGAPDPSFQAPKLRSTLPQEPFVIRSVANLPDGKMLIGGDFITPNGCYGLARLLPDGTIDAVFERNLGPGFVPDGDIRRGVIDIAVQQDGKIIVAGSYFSQDRRIQRTLTRLNADGTTDRYPSVAEVGLR